MTTITLTCEACGAEFERRSSEARRNKIANLKIYCSRKCVGKMIASKTAQGKRVHTSNLPIKRSDELSPFRPHIKSMKCHALKINRSVLVDANDLKLVWDKQNGICPITGWKMVNFINTRDRPQRSPDRASVDRLDSTKDYTIDNVRFICLIAQFAKNNFTDDDLFRFCQAVATYRYQYLARH